MPMSRKFIEGILDDLAKVLGLIDASQIKESLNIDERIEEAFGNASVVQMQDMGVTV